MSQQPLPAIGPKHYQAICGLALGTIFVLQMQQDIALPINLAMLLIGTAAILPLRFATRAGAIHRLHLSPAIVFLAIVGGQLLDQYWQSRFVNPDFVAFRFLDVDDLLLCLAVLMYLAGAYRLHAVWFNILPHDVRQARKETTANAAPSPLARSEGLLTAAELLGMVVALPLFVLAAEGCALMLKQRWDLVGLPARWRQVLALAWIIVVVVFVAAHFFRYWRRSQMDGATAALLLQDVLWNETRGEQRQINRWTVWRKLQKQEEEI